MRLNPTQATPGKKEVFEPSPEIEVTDPTHPLYGRRFPLLNQTSSLIEDGHVWVAYRESRCLRIVLAATNLGVSRPKVRTKFTPEGIMDLIHLARESEGICRLPQASCGPVSPKSSVNPSELNSSES